MSDSSRPVALVTGAARRIGAAIARTLHAAGYDLALHAHRSRHELAALADELDALRPDGALPLHGDLADADVPSELVAATLARYGRLDALVNNASAFRPTPLGTIAPADWDELFLVNARAPLLLSQAAAAPLLEADGAIVNLADIYADRPLAGHAVYVMSKAALIAMTQALAVDLAPRVRVNAIAPGAILWPDAGKSNEVRDAIVARTPLARSGNPDEIASAVLWLLRGGGFVTGQMLRVDGGRSLSV